MRRIATPCGPRWRCLASLEIARKDAATRDALAKARTEANRMLARSATEHLNRHRALSVFDPA
jgi:hypothetical protein